MAEQIAVGCDHAALEMKKFVSDQLAEAGYEVKDFGTHSADSCDYPDIAHALCAAVESGEVWRGVLICGTGVGMSIAANRHPGIRAVVCSEPLSARMSRQHNDANVLCMGARVIGVETARDILRSFLDADFEGGRHQRRVDKITP